MDPIPNPNPNRIFINSPNFIVFSSANKPINKSANNRSNQQQTPSNSNSSQPRMFKIRTFTSKVGVGKSARIQGKRITQEAIASIKQQSQNWLKPTAACRRPSIQLNKAQSHNQNNQSRKSNKASQSVIFKEIEIYSQAERCPLPFRKLDLAHLSTLAHRPYLWLNQKKLTQQQKEYVLLVSSNFINLEPKRIRPAQRPYRSQKSVNYNTEHQFSADTHNILSNLCGKQGQGSFLGRCKVFLKVNSQTQLQDLRQYLQENQLQHFDGIVNIRARHSDAYTLYSLQDLLAEEQKLILLEEQSTLKQQIPLIQSTHALFITLHSKDLTSVNILKIINQLRDAKTEPSKLLSHSKRPSVEEQKQNLHPNIGQSSHKKSNIKRQRVQAGLYLKDEMKQKELHLQMGVLMSKHRQMLESKRIKNVMRQNRCISKKNLNTSLPEKEEMRNRSIQNKSFEAAKEAKIVVNLQGEFKQKMTKYVKILQNERASIKQVNRLGKQTQSDLDELTYHLTNRLKSKTPFQLVGDLLRSNGHIARQIGKYLNEMRPLYNWQEVQQSQEEEQANANPILLYTLK